jgi:hypothetical protein
VYNSHLEAYGRADAEQVSSGREWRSHLLLAAVSRRSRSCLVWALEAQPGPEPKVIELLRSPCFDSECSASSVPDACVGRSSALTLCIEITTPACLTNCLVDIVICEDQWRFKYSLYKY